MDSMVEMNPWQIISEGPGHWLCWLCMAGTGDVQTYLGWWECHLRNAIWRKLASTKWTCLGYSPLTSKRNVVLSDTKCAEKGSGFYCETKWFHCLSEKGGMQELSKFMLDNGNAFWVKLIVASVLTSVVSFYEIDVVYSCCWVGFIPKGD